MPAFKQLSSVSYSAFNSTAYLHFAIRDTSLDLDSLRRYVEKVASSDGLKNRPVVVYNFDHLEEAVILSG